MKEQEQKKKKVYPRHGHRKEVLFKDDEWEIVKAKVAKMNLSTTRYIVKMVLSGESVPQDFIGFTELSRQLSLIGNNLNQLARKANTINNIYADDYEQMRKKFNSLCLLLKQKYPRYAEPQPEVYLRPCKNTEWFKCCFGKLYARRTQCLS